MILRRTSPKKNVKVKGKSRCAWQTKDLYNFCKDHTTKIFLIMPRNKLGNCQRKELRLTAWVKVYMDFKAFRRRVGKRKEKMVTRLVPQLQLPLCLQCCDTSLHAKDPPLGFWKIQHLNTLRHNTNFSYYCGIRKISSLPRCPFILPISEFLVFSSEEILGRCCRHYWTSKATSQVTSQAQFMVSVLCWSRSSVCLEWNMSLFSSAVW